MLRLTTTNKLPADFVLVAMDKSSLRLDGLDPEEIDQSRALQLMKAGYPWSREVYALFIDRVMEAGARMVILDLVLPTSRPGDDTLAKVLLKYQGRIVLASRFDFIGQNNVEYTPPAPAFAEAAPEAVGYANFPHWFTTTRELLLYATQESMWGKIPASPLGAKPSLATAAARVLGKNQPMDFQPRRFRYSVPGSVDIVPLYQIFLAATWERNCHLGAIFRDRVVLLGPTAEELKDFLITPFDRMAGPEVHMHALAAMLRGDWIRPASPLALRLSIPVAGLMALSLVMYRRNVWWFALMMGVGALLWFAICLAAFVMASWFLPMAPPLSAWFVCGCAALACDVSLERRERGRLRHTLERYVSRDVVHEIVENPESYLQTLGGQRKDVVILFSDLKGFTADSERLDPSELVAMLNEYFGEMVEVVFLHAGTIDKFMGDALMATWGCIQSHGPRTDAQNAVRAALEMKERLKGINSRRGTDVAPWGSGIGICQGSVIFGNIGSQQKMEPTVIGDTVNLASRFEGLTRMYGCGLLLNETMAENVGEICEVLLVDVVRVKGRKKPEKLYFAHLENDPGWIEGFLNARELYVAGKFAEADRVFEKLATGGLAPELAQNYQKRCQLLAQEPPEDWTGIWNFQEK